MRIAQITDLHARSALWGFPKLPVRRSRMMFDLLARALHKLRQQHIDLLALTGDLLDVPAWLHHPAPGFVYDEPAPWHSAARRDYQRLKQLLDATGIPYIVLPGNHDDHLLMHEVFDLTSPSITVAGHDIHRFCDHEHQHHVPRRFVPQREHWEACLADTSGRPQVHLQHYLITPRHDEKYPHTYLEADDMLRKMVNCPNIRLALSGHYHTGTDLLRVGNCYFSTCPAFCEAPFTYRIYTLDSQGVTMQSLELGRDLMPKRPCVFIDRDGVILQDAAYWYGPDRIKMIPQAGQAIARLRQAGYACVVMTQQSCVAHGYVPQSIVAAVHDKMNRLLAEAGGELDAIYYDMADHTRAVLPDKQYNDMSNAKPSPAMILRAAKELNLDLTRSWMIGDRETDVLMGLNAGVKPILVHTGWGREREPASRTVCTDLTVVADLNVAADALLAHPTRN